MKPFYYYANIYDTLPLKPLVSICIPAFNSEETIASTIQSILAQTYNNLEIIVLDNASTDNTPDVISKFNDKRLILIRNEINIGAEANFTKGVNLAKGEFVALFHADDIYDHQIIEKQVHVFEKYPEVGAVFTMAQYINDQRKIIGHSKLPVRIKKKELCTSLKF
jgi:glycosyltransferase involved in cell wall biosynthesis